TISVIVPAAGCGARAGLNGNKILAPLCGRPLLAWTLEALLRTGHPAAGTPETDLWSITELIIAARPDEWDLVRAAAAGLRLTPRLVNGGATRQDSVFQAVTAAGGEYVLVHDA